MEFKSAGSNLNWEYHPDHIDIVKVILDEPLIPGASTTITSPFRVQIPDGRFSRLGHIEKAYTITQWYPKPAVYDQNGWHPMPYLDQGEFYSEFGTFDVKLTLPENFVVGATGDMINGENEYAWLDSITTSTANGNIRPKQEYIPSNKTKTLHFHQEKVHDFAWFADMRYHVLKGEVALASGKKVSTWAMFTRDEADLWMNSIEYINDAVLNYSKWVGEYPYSHATAVDGTISAGGGMEYPNITVIGRSGSPFNLEVVIAHEVGHNWFYGILGNNERASPWLDEGLNSYYEARHLMHKYPDAGVLGRKSEGLQKKLGVQDMDYWGRFELAYLFNARRGLDQAIHLHSEEYTAMNYGTIVYAKSALVLKHLAGYLGQETYDECMKSYFERWKFKHPGPNDLRQCFEEVSGKELSWFFNEMVGSTKKFDIAVSKKGKELKVEQKGKLEAPLTIGTTTGEEWFDSPQQTVGNTSSNGDVVIADPKWKTIDANRRNNRIKMNRAGRGRPFQLKTFGGIEDPNRSQLFWSPIAGWNEYNKWMLGAAVYSNVFPSRKFEYVLAPLYAFGTKDLSGSAKFSYSIDHTSAGYVQRSRLGLGARRYAVWHDRDLTVHSEKLAPYLETIGRRSVNDHRSHHLRLKADIIWEDFDYHTDAGTDQRNENIFLGLDYTYKNDHKLTPYLTKIELMQHEQFVRASLEAKVRHHYNRKKKSVGLRTFIGTFIWQDLKESRYTWNMGGITGTDDFTYAGVFLGRNESTGVLSQQFLNEQGAFKAPTRFGQSDSYIFTINADVDIPFPLPISLFADIGIAPVVNVGEDGSKTTKATSYYDFGVGFPIVRDIFEIWMPLAFADDIKDEFEFKDLTFGEQIRFTLRLELLDPFEQIRNINP